MATFNKFNCFVQDVGRKVHNLDSDTLKVMLTNVAPVATNTKKADLTEIAAGNGYTAGGSAAANNDFTQSSGTGKLTADDVVFTASGGDIAAFRYIVLYNDTSTDDSLIAWSDRGSSQIVPNGETYTVDFDAVNGILIIA